MASRRFKEKWIPEPLPASSVERLDDEVLDQPATSARRLLAVLWYFVQLMYRTAVVRVIPSLGRGRYSLRENGLFARRFVERMGGTWVAVARLASLRPDMLGIDYCRELARSRDHSLPVPLGVVRDVINAELQKRGTTLDDEFDELVETPVATGSFFQVHLARRKADGLLVTLRVIRPNAHARAQMDIRHFDLLMGLLDRSGYMTHMRWKDLLNEGKKIAEDQLDFRAEESQLLKIAKLLRPRRIYVPRLYRRYTTERLLVCEHVTGVSVADLGAAIREDQDETDLWMRRNRINRRRVCRRLFYAHLELLFEHNLFFTELLSDSILLLKGNRIALVTLKTVETLEASMLRKYRTLYQTLVTKDYMKAGDIFLSMGPPLPRKELATFRTMVMRSLKGWESRTYIKTCPYEEKSLTAAMRRLSICAGQCNLPVSWELSRLHFAEQTLDVSLEILYSELPFLKTLYKYDRAAQFRTIESATDNAPRRLRALSDLAQVGMQLAENFEFDNDYLRRRVMSFQGKIGLAGKVAKRILGTLMRIALAAVAVEGFVYFKDKYDLSVGPDQGLIGHTRDTLDIQDRWTWMVVIAVVLYTLYFLRKLTKRLAQEEFRPTGSR